MLFVSIFLSIVKGRTNETNYRVVFLQNQCENCICRKLVVSYDYQVLCYLSLDLSALLVSFLKVLVMSSFIQITLVLYAKYNTVYLAQQPISKLTRYRPYLQEFYILGDIKHFIFTHEHIYTLIPGSLILLLFMSSFSLLSVSDILVSLYLTSFTLEMFFSPTILAIHPHGLSWIDSESIVTM